MNGTGTAVKDETENPEKVPDLEAIAPEPGAVLVIGAQSPKGGVEVRVNRLRTIEFLSLMRAVARGAGPGLATLDFSDDQNEMMGEILAIFLMAIPEAGDLFLDFVRKVTVPAVETKDGKNRARVDEELQNPELEDLLSILEMVALQEMDDIKGLVGKAQGMWTHLSASYNRSYKPG